MVISAKEITERPIIGILTAPVVEELAGFDTKYTEVVMGKHTHFIEGGGGRVFPINYRWSREEMRSSLLNLNGLFFPDYHVNFFEDHNRAKFSPYATAVFTLIEIAKEFNNNGTYFPIWATSSAFELIILSETKNILSNTVTIKECSNCKDYNAILSYNNNHTILLRNLYKNLAAQMRVKKVFHFDHKHILTLGMYESSSLLQEKYKAASYSKTPNGETIVSSIEHSKYPFYAVQYNPGDWLYEWDLNKKIVKDAETMLLGHKFSNFFINECKKNKNKFPGGYPEELRSIIESHYQLFHPVYGHLYLFN